MVTRYTPYVRRGVSSASIAAPGIQDQAALRQSIATQQSIQTAANRVIDFALKRGEKAAKFRGTQEGALRPETTLAKGMPTNAYEEAAYAAAVNVSASQIELKARDRINQAVFAAETNELDPVDLQEDLDDIKNGFTASLDNLDPVVAAKLNASLSAVNKAAFIEFSEKHLKRVQAEQAAKFIPFVDEQSRIVQILAQGGDLDLAYAQIQVTRPQGAALNASDKQIETSIVNLTYDLHRARVRGEFDRALQKSPADAEKYLNAFSSDAIRKRTGAAQGLDDTNIKMLRGEMSAILKSNTAQATQILVGARDAAVKTKKIIADGKAPDANEVASILSVLDESPLESDKILAHEIKLINDTRIMFEGNDVQKKNEIFIAYKAQIGDEVSTQENLIFEYMESSIARDQKQLQLDQVEYLNRYGANLPELTRETLLAASAGDTQAQAIISNRFSSIRTAAHINNVDPIYFSQNEHEAFAAVLGDKRVAFEEKALLIESMAVAFGIDALPALEELGQKNPGVMSQAAIIYGHTGDSETLRDVFAGLGADTSFIEGITKTEVATEVVSLMQQDKNKAFSGESINMFVNTVYALMNGRAMQDKEIDKVENMIQLALGATLDGREVVAGGFYNVDGRGSVLLHPQMSVDAIENVDEWLNKAKPDDLVGFFTPVGADEAIYPTYGNGERISKTDLQGAKFGYNDSYSPGIVQLLTANGNAYSTPVFIDLLQLNSFIKTQQKK